MNKKIRNKRELAIRLSNGGKVNITEISKNLDNILIMWKNKGDVILKNDFAIGCF